MTTEALKAALRDAEVRIERLSGPHMDVPGVFLHRLARPVLSAFGWTPTLRLDKTQALFVLLGNDGAHDACVDACQDAAAELLENIKNVEQAAAVWHRTPMAHAAWLARVHRALRSIAVELGRGPAVSAGLRDVAAALGTGVLSPPIAWRRPKAASAKSESGAQPHTAGAAPRQDRAAKLIDLELGAIDHLLELARAEIEYLGRRRDHLEAARRLLLDVSAALPLDAEGVRARLRTVAIELARIDRYVAAGIDPEVELLYQARQAASRGDELRLRGALSALSEYQSRSGSVQGAELAARAVQRLWGDPRELSDEMRRQADRRFSEESLGVDVVAQVEAGYLARKKAASNKDLPLALRNSEANYVEDGVAQTLHCTAAVDGYFELGGHVSPVRVTEHERFVRVVRHPAPAMQLLPASSVEDLPDAIIEDPRLVLMHLATGRLLARRYVEVYQRKITKPGLSTEVRVFLLDGSSSMGIARARVRDALLLAELATLKKRLNTPRHVRPVLFYAYFDEEVGPMTRVDSVPGVLTAIREVIETRRQGGTDIQRALLASFETLAQQRQRDRELAQAQIVLVTDGESEVDEATLVAKRKEAQGQVPLGVSVIALGEENAALRGLVARQRAQGERAFYHYADDDTVLSMSKSPTGLPMLRLLAPATDEQEVAGSLSARVDDLLAELQALGRTADPEEIEQAEAQATAEGELGVSAVAEGPLAQLEAKQRDRRALALRFDKWFPAPNEALLRNPVFPDPLDPDSEDGADLDTVVFSLASVAEVLQSFGGSELARTADAIVLFERLLGDARMGPARYHALLENYPAHVSSPLAILRAQVLRPG
jgi:hypothetical protein